MVERLNLLTDIRTYLISMPGTDKYSLAEVDLQDKSSQLAALLSTHREKWLEYYTNPKWAEAIPNLTPEIIRLSHLIMEGRLWIPLTITEKEHGILKLQIETKFLDSLKTFEQDF